MKQTFFELRALDARGAARADGFGPLPEMPFFEGIGMQEFSRSRRAHWAVNPEPPGMEIAAGASEWSDFIYCAHSPPDIFASQRVVDALEREGVELLRKTEMPIARIRAKRLREIEPPSYYVLEAVPGMTVDFTAMEVATDVNGRPCWTSEQMLKLPQFIFDVTSWNGSDLFSLSNCSAPILLICKERIVELTGKEKWSNIEFKPLGG